MQAAYETYRIERYIYGKTGKVMDARIYPVFRKPGKKRSQANPTPLCQELINQENAKNELYRLVVGNFDASDLALHLTYALQPDSVEQVQRDMRNFVARIKTVYRKAQALLKYIYIIEYGKRGRLHIHMILSGGVNRTIIEQKWGLGWANTRSLQMEDMLERLVTYMSKDPVTSRRWSCSKNLERPEPEVDDYAVTQTDAAQIVDRPGDRGKLDEMFPDWEIMEEPDARTNPVNHLDYVFVRMVWIPAAIKARIRELEKELETASPEDAVSIIWQLRKIRISLFMGNYGKSKPPQPNRRKQRWRKKKKRRDQ